MYQIIMTHFKTPILNVVLLSNFIQ